MEIIGLILGLLGLVWTAVLIKRGGLLAGCLLVLLVGSCFGHAFFHASVITLDRLLLAVLLAFYVLQLSQNRLQFKPVTVPDVLVGLLLLVLLVSTFTHDWRLDEAQAVSKLVFFWIMPALMYWLGRASSLRAEHLRWFLICFSAFGIYLSLTAVAEMAGWSAFVVPRYIVSREHWEFLGRGRGPFLNPLANGIYISTCLTCLLMCFPRAGMVGRWAIGVGALVMCAGCAATLTRCVWLGLVLGLATITWLCFPRRIRLGILILAFCIASLSVTVNWSRLSAFKRDKHVSVTAMAKSAELRPMLAAVAWQMFSQRPWNGVGFGQYEVQSHEFIAARRLNMPLDQVRGYHQHNVVFALLAETGLLGTLPYLALLTSWFLAALHVWRSERIPLEIRQLAVVFIVTLVNYVANGLFHDVTVVWMVNLLLFFLAGTIVSAVLATDTARSWEWRRLAAAVKVRSPKAFSS